MLPSLDDLLFMWEERRAAGELVSAADLCADCPTLEAELEERIRLLQGVDQLLTVNQSSTETDRDLQPLPGTIAGYEVRQVLGSGGMGVVYRVWDPVLKRPVALKMLRPAQPLLEPEDTARLARRFQQEAQVLAQLKHEYIVPIYEAKLHDGQPYFVMECVEGGTLRTHGAAMTAAGPRVILPFVEKVARGLEFAHGRGILHRDLKPGNILLVRSRGQGTRNGESSANPPALFSDPRSMSPKISDFGLAKLLDETCEAEAESPSGTDPTGGVETTAPDVSTRLTIPGYQPGTPPYMAPEQFDASFGPISQATDVWSLGVIFYELLVGEKPFREPTRAALRKQICKGDFTHPRAVRPRLGRRVEAIVLRCLATSPQQRYPSAGAVADALAACQKSRFRPLLWGVAATLAGLSLLVSLWVTGILGRQPDRRDVEPSKPDAMAYLRDVEPIMSRLEKESEVDLISAGPDRRAVHFVANGEAATKVSQGPDGLHVHSPSQCCLVEFLPRVPAVRYRITAQIRLDYHLTDEFEWGVYCKHSAFTTEKGQHHTFQAVWLHGSDPKRLSATLQQRLFCDLGPPAQKPFRDWRLGSMDGRFRQDADFSDTRWQTIDLQVDPSGIVATCAPSAGKGVLLGPLNTEDSEMLLMGSFALEDDLKAIQPAQLQGSALGLFVRTGVCTVRQFIVHLEKDN